MQTVCTQGKSGILLADLDTAIEQVAQAKPGVLDVNNQATPSSGQYKILDPKAVPLDIRFEQVQPVGRYAVTIAFSDGHTTGIYPFKKLRSLGEAPKEEFSV